MSGTERRFIPVAKPFLTGKEKKYVLDAVESGWISSAGSYIEKFEHSFADMVQCKYATSCANGTAAVHLALLAAGVGPGDKVVVPTFTMMASVFPIYQVGAEAIFVDSEPDTWNIDCSKLEDIKTSVKAIMPVHIYGHPVDMDPLKEWAKRKGAIVIEDAAEAQGALYKNQPCGSLGDVAAFSFYANKVLTCGEGGAVTTNSLEMIEKARYYKNLCFDKDPAKRFIHEDFGYNFRMTNLQAAIGYAQVEESTRLVELRRQMAQKYLTRLQDLADDIQLPVEKPWAKNVYWMFGVVLKDHVKLDAAAITQKLKAEGVDTRRFFYPGHRQPVFGSSFSNVDAPVADRLWDRGFYLPSSNDLNDDEADYIVKTLKSLI